MDVIGRTADGDVSSSLASAAAGDQAAFARIVARYQEELFSIAVLVTRDRSLAEDAIQSAWAIAWRKLDTIRSPGIASSRNILVNHRPNSVRLDASGCMISSVGSSWNASAKVGATFSLWFGSSFCIDGYTTRPAAGLPGRLRVRNRRARPDRWRVVEDPAQTPSAIQPPQPRSSPLSGPI